MTGGVLIEITSQLRQDVFLTGNPQLTFFKSAYKRHTRFSYQYIKIKPTQKDLDFLPQKEFSQTLTFNIGRYGDLLSEIYLSIDIPNIISDFRSGFRWCDYLGYVIARESRFYVGDVLIDTQFSEWMAIWNELTIEKGKKELAYYKMIGNSNDFKIYPRNLFSNNIPMDSTNKEFTDDNVLYTKKRLYIPIKFFFTENPGLSFPLIACQYQPVRVEIDFTAPNEWFLMGSSEKSPDNYFALSENEMGIDDVFFRQKLIKKGYNQNNVWDYFMGPNNKYKPNIFLNCKYIYLSDDERNYMSHSTHEYLIHQVSRLEFTNLGCGPNKLKLDFINPIKELIFVSNKKSIRENNNQFNYEQFEKPQIFNYYNEALNNTLFSTYLPNLITATGFGILKYFSQAFVQSTFVINLANILNDINKELIKSKKNQSDNPLNILQGARLLINNNVRQEYKDYNFYNKVQPLEHHTNRSNINGVNLYSFSLYPEKNQPSETMNFSNITKAFLEVHLKEDYKILNYVQLYGMISNYNNYAIINKPEPTGGTSYNPDSKVEVNPNLKDYETRVYALSYNILRVVGGSAATVFVSKF